MNLRSEISHEPLQRRCNTSDPLRWPRADPGSFLGPVILVLAANTKQFKDSNFFVLKAAFHGIKILLDATPEAGSAKRNNTAVSTVLSPAVEKLGDRKLQVICVRWFEARKYTHTHTHMFRYAYLRQQGLVDTQV